MNDAAIVEGFFRRDERAVAQARELYGSYCMYIAEGLLRDKADSEECVNDAFLGAWNSIPPQSPKNLKTYLAKLTRNRSVDILRKRDAEKRKRDTDPFDEIARVSEQMRLDETLNARELGKKVSEYLKSLKETERTVFVRRYWYGDSIDGICEAYGFGKSRVKMMLKRTRDGLAEYLKREGYQV